MKKKQSCRIIHRGRSISFAETLHARIDAVVQESERSFNWIVTRATEEYLDRYQAAKLQDKQKTGSLKK